MRKFIMIAALAMFATQAQAVTYKAGNTTLKGCTTDAECAKVDGEGDPKPRDTTKIKACAAQWKVAKADEAVKASGWPKFWHECSVKAKEAAKIAP
jgi:hypothetical protein